MSTSFKPKVAIVDYSLGNLFSVKNACSKVELDSFITSRKKDVLEADAVILPGVGAFGDAMDNLCRLDLIAPLRDIAQSTTPLIGICLGQQLLMRESHEFGRHKGLDIIEGEVVRFDNPSDAQGPLKVPQVGWNRVCRPGGNANAWTNTPLEPIRDGEFMYFVHSFYVQPARAESVLAVTRYGQIEFCSSLRKDNVISFQFHPERSGLEGMKVYEYLAASIYQQTGSKETRHAA